MSKFIKLHTTEDNSVVILKISDIIAVYTVFDNDDNKVTEIQLDNDTVDTVTVNENPEKILSSLNNNTEFIKVHDTENNSVMILNSDYISCVCINDDTLKGSIIYFDSDEFDEVQVNESSEKIFSMIEDNNL